MALLRRTNQATDYWGFISNEEANLAFSLAAVIFYFPLIPYKTFLWLKYDGMNSAKTFSGINSSLAVAI